MRKIPTLFVRDPKQPRFLLQETHPDCLWVVTLWNSDTMLATEKLDGTNVRLTIRSGSIVRLEKRRNPTKRQKASDIVMPWYVDAECGASDKWIREAAEGTDTSNWPDGEHCCEALGPKIQGDPLGLEQHLCYPFDLKADEIALKRPSACDFGTLRKWIHSLGSVLSPGHHAEGVVFHVIDGPSRAKLKRRDF